MHTIRRIHIRPGAALLAAVLLLLALTALSAVAVPKPIDDTTVFDLLGVREINLTAAGTRVNIIRAPEGSAARMRLHGETTSKAWLEYRRQGDVLTVVEMREPAYALRPDTLALDVYLPVSFTRDLTVDTASGVLTVDAFTLHTLNLYTASGDVSLKPLTVDTLSVSSVSGAIAVEALTADTLRVDAMSGAVDIGELRARDAAVCATSAEVCLCYAAYEGGALTVQNTSGNIRLTLPADASFGFAICRTSSTVCSDFADIAAVCAQPDTLCGAVNGGRGSLRIDSVSGEIDISKQS